MTKSIIINFALFQLGWFACVLGGAYDLTLIGSLIALSVIAYHLYRAEQPGQELRLLMLAVFIGIVFESIISTLDLAHYNSGQILENIAPLWMILMWPLFATTLNLSMRWLKNITLLLTSLVGLVFAPLAYYAGNNLGAVEYDVPLLSLSIIAMSWALLLPLLVLVSNKHNGYINTTLKADNREVTVNV